jgi:hypothetical protein
MSRDEVRHKMPLKLFAEEVIMEKRPSKLQQLNLVGLLEAVCRVSASRCRGRQVTLHRRLSVVGTLDYWSSR